MTQENVGGAPAVSIVIPTYNHQEYVVRTLESVWAQTNFDYEIIVVNDGSPDNTREVLAQFVKSGRITKYIEQPNAGQGAARNRGIAEARGEFVALLDDDDCWPADKIEWQVQALRTMPSIGVVYGFPRPVNGQGDPIEPCDAYGNLPSWPWTAPTGNIYEAMTKRCWIVSPGQTMIRRSILKDITFDPQIRGCDDWDLWLRIAEKWEFLFVERAALLYRLHGANASQDTLSMRKNDFILLNKHIRRNLFSPKRLWSIAYRYAAFLRWTPFMMMEQSRSDIQAGRLSSAREKLRYALSLRPYLLFRPGFRSLWREANQEVRA